MYKRQGYGAQKKVNLTGAVASVDVNKTIDSRPITDIGLSLIHIYQNINPDLVTRLFVLLCCNYY